MSIIYLEELIPLHIRKRYNITTKTKIGESLQSAPQYKVCRKCFEQHETRECNKDWIKIVYPETLEELISLYDIEKYNINTKNYIIHDNSKLEPPLIILSIDSETKNDELLTIIRNNNLYLDLKKKDYNWDDLATIISIWCFETGRNIILYKEYVNCLCEEYQIEIDEDAEWEKKAEAIKEWGKRTGREIIIGSKPPPTIGYKLK